MTTVCQNAGATTNNVLDTADGAVSSPVDAGSIEQNLRDQADETLTDTQQVHGVVPGIAGLDTDDVGETLPEEQHIHGLLPGIAGPDIDEATATIAERAQAIRDRAMQIQMALREVAGPSLAIGEPDESAVVTISFVRRLSPPVVADALDDYVGLEPKKAYAGYPGQFYYFVSTLIFEELADLSRTSTMTATYRAAIEHKVRQYTAVPTGKLPPGYALLLEDSQQEMQSADTSGIPLIGVTVQTTREQARQIAREHTDWVVSAVGPACDIAQVVLPDESADPYVRRLDNPLPDVNVSSDLFEAPTADGAPPPIVNPLDVPLEPVPGPDGSWVEDAGTPQ